MLQLVKLPNSAFSTTDPAVYTAISINLFAMEACRERLSTDASPVQANKASKAASKSKPSNRKRQCTVVENECNSNDVNGGVKRRLKKKSRVQPQALISTRTNLLSSPP